MVHKTNHGNGPNSIAPIASFTGFDLVQAYQRTRDFAEFERQAKKKNGTKNTPYFSVYDDDTMTIDLDYPLVVSTMVGIAAGRGWSDIAVNGTTHFRQAAWIEAHARGLGVQGYAPTGMDLNEAKGRAKEIARTQPKAQSRVAHFFMQWSRQFENTARSTLMLLTCLATLIAAIAAQAINPYLVLLGFVPIGALVGLPGIKALRSVKRTARMKR